MKHWRLNVVLFFIIVVAAGIVARLFFLQVLNHKFYQSQALGQQAGFQEVVGNRGKIFLEDSKGSKGSQGTQESSSLALNQTTWNVSVVPKNIKDIKAITEGLAPIIGDSVKTIAAKIEKSDSYIVIKKGVGDKELAAIKALNLAGVQWEEVPARYYPQKNFAAQVAGFVGGNGEGQYGLEGYYEDILKGKEGLAEEKAGLGAIGASQQSASELDGSDIYATIDYNIQFQAEALLKQAYQDFSIDSGQIIVLKPDSGRVVALANFPSFDPNKYGQEKGLEVFQNGAVQKLFEPGSIFKPFTMAMALEDGKVSPETTFTDKGSVTIGPDTIYNFDHEKYGLRDMSGILEKSINTGAVFLEQLVGREKFAQHIDDYGFSEKTGIDLQGEVSSRNDALKKGSNFGFATASFGQGIQMTPIQLARSFSIFANGGRLPKVFIADKIIHGTDEQDTKTQLSKQVISQKTADEVTKMLINVVERGFGSGARINGYWLAGKTGTAEVPLTTKKGYYQDRTVQSFIGFGPALKPQFLILVKLDNPKVPKSSLSAAPIFKKLAQYIIDYWQIPPDYDPNAK